MVRSVSTIGGARGGLGGYSPPSEGGRKNLASRWQEMLGSCWRRFGKMTYERLHFLVILAPLSEALVSLPEDFWRHPWLCVRNDTQNIAELSTVSTGSMVR